MTPNFVDITPEQHQALHVTLHREFDRLLACYLAENRFAGRRTSIHDEIFALMKWSHDKTLIPSPAPESSEHNREPQFLVAQNDDPELLEWLANAKQSGGGFVSSIANAGLVADHDNYPLIRYVLMALRKKYPAYEPSDAVKQEIRERIP